MIQNIQICKWPYRNLYKIISNFWVWRNWLNTNITSRNLKSPATQLFVQLLALNYYKENIKTLHYRLLMRGIYWCILLTKYQWIRKAFPCHHIDLTLWGRDKMDAISQTTYSNAFSWMKMYEFRLKFHWSLFPWIQLTIFQHWFR